MNTTTNEGTMTTEPNETNEETTADAPATPPRTGRRAAPAQKNIELTPASFVVDLVEARAADGELVPIGHAGYVTDADTADALMASVPGALKAIAVD